MPNIIKEVILSFTDTSVFPARIKMKTVSLSLYVKKALMKKGSI